VVWIAAITVSIAGYVYLGYFLERTDFNQIIAVYFPLFGIYLFLIYTRFFNKGILIIVGAAFLLRLSMLAMTPNLTDDYFRNIWDGLLVANGQNPFMTTPAELIQRIPNIPGIDPVLFDQLNSPYYYSAYPPITQYIFGLSVKIFGDSVLANVIFFRIIILFAEFGTIMLLYRLTKKFQLPSSLVVLYAFNPLVIIELTGNLHFEAIMIFFVVFSIYWLVTGRQVLSAVTFALAVGVKLIPLLFLPLLLKHIGTSRSIRYYLIVGITTVLFCLPFLNIQAVSHYLSSLSLYFRAFEFNASIYYLIKGIILPLGNSDISTNLGIVLSVVIFVVIITFAVIKRDHGWISLVSGMLFCLTVYYLLAAHIHPWNLTPLLVLTIFTGYRYMLPWSLLVILTYSTYRTFPYAENLWLVAIEYIVVAGWFIYEWRARRKARQSIAG